jgi:hypothetical protein
MASEIRRSAPLTWLKMRGWVHAFGPEANVAYRASSWAHPLSDMRALWTSWKLWQMWKRAPADTNWVTQSIDDVVCGDLVIDSFLRYRPAPSFDPNDPLVWRLLWQLLRDIHRARHYFGEHRPDTYLTSYSTYIEHGIPVRIALQEGVPVYAFGVLLHLGNRLTPTHLTHTHDCTLYRVIFEALPVQEQQRCLQLAEGMLNNRLSGGVDTATAYMRKSAYANNAADASLPETLCGAVVIFLHDFYDSPHCYENVFFTDFWDWICSTIEALDEAGVQFFIKPHPNQIALSDDAVRKLRAKYPGSRWLDPSTNNVQLAKAGIACGVTVYGTVAHELAFLGVPSIGAAIHPHYAFDFCRTAHSKSEYLDLLRSYKSRPLSNAEMRRQALEFYSIHNNLHRPEEADLAQALTAFYAAATNKDIPPNVVVIALDNLRHQRGYAAFISSLPLGEPNVSTDAPQAPLVVH